MLDGCTRFHLDSQKRLSAYLGFGLVGAFVGSALVLAVGNYAGQPVTLSAVAIVAAPLFFLCAIKVSHLVRGREVLVMSEKLIAALLGTALSAKALGMPILATVDLAALGVSAFLVFGRLGCAGASCCFGRPSKHGFRYSETHAQFGFPRGLVGVPLFPIQLVESLAHGLLTMVTAVAIVQLSPGSALVAYLIGYSLTRVLSEVARGDAARSMFFGLSETQWIAAVTLGGIGLVVSDLRPALLGACSGVFAIVWWIQRRRLSAQEIEGIAQALGELGSTTANVSSAVTANGLVLSRNSVNGVTHYALSRTEPSLSADRATHIAKLISLLTDGAPLRRLQGGSTGTHHFETARSDYDAADPAPKSGSAAT